MEEEAESRTRGQSINERVDVFVVVMVHSWILVPGKNVVSGDGRSGRGYFEVRAPSFVLHQRQARPSGQTGAGQYQSEPRRVSVEADYNIARSALDASSCSTAVLLFNSLMLEPSSRMRPNNQ